jgi:hypothetical protein
MKIARHDQEGVDENSWGLLLGVQNENNFIEISDSYPLMSKDFGVIISNKKSKFERTLSLITKAISEDLLIRPTPTISREFLTKQMPS